MQLIGLSLKQCGQQVLAIGLIVLLVGSLFASAAAADAAIGIPKAGVSATEATVGENVTVSAQVVNVGDSGGGDTVEFERNGTTYGTRWATFETTRVSLAADERQTINATIQFDRPGTYALRVNNKRAGVVTVTSTRARVESATDSQRRLDFRANDVSKTEAIEFDIPASNRSVALQRWSPTTGQSSFQQYLTEYTNRSETPVDLRSSADSPLFGVIDFESEDEFRESTMRIGVDDSVVANASLDRDEVVIYQRNGAGWEPLSTSVADEGPNRTVYEATATRATAYAVGRIDPNISLANTSYRSVESANGVRLEVEGRLRNTAPMAGTYVGSLRVNGETVNQTTVTVPASDEANVSLSYEVTEAGEYRLALNRTRVGSVLVTGGQIADSQSTESSAGVDTGVSPGGVADTVDGAIPPTVLGIDTLYLGGGLAIALSVFVVVLLLLRRGGGGGGGRPDSFDPW